MRRWGVVAALVALTPATAISQTPLRAYALNVAVGMGDGPFSTAGFTDLQRGRAMFTQAFGPVALDLAYEGQLAYRSATDAMGFAESLGRVGGVTWLPLQGSGDIDEHWSWAHRIDRAAVTVRGERGELVVGRQAISWATTLLLTPADPFAPFEPSEPFRDYRGGVDALRARLFPGPFTELDAVVRPAETAVGTTLTVLARGAARLGRWELAAWAGVVHDAAAGAIAATVTAAGAVVRFEGTLRHADGAAVPRFTLGVDRSFAVGGRTLYLIGEYQYDEFGAADGDALLGVLVSPAARRGELQVLGRHTVAFQGSLDVHPLVSVALLGLWSAGDGSLLVAPAVSYAAAGTATVRGGTFVGIGRDRSASGGPGSEYGAVPPLGYAALSLFW